jgi:hypothetical protein
VRMHAQGAGVGRRAPFDTGFHEVRREDRGGVRKGRGDGGGRVPDRRRLRLPRAPRWKVPLPRSKPTSRTWTPTTSRPRARTPWA